MTIFPFPNLVQGDVVTYPWPYIDNNEDQITKARPVLVVSGKKYNSILQNKYVIAFQITSKKRSIEYELPITKNDSISLYLRQESFVRVDMPLAIDKSKIAKAIGKVKIEFLSKIKEKIVALYEIKQKII